MSSPATHDVRFSTKDLGQTADHDIGIRHDLDIDKVSDSLVDDHDETMFVGELPDFDQIGGSQKRVSGELAEQR